MSTQENLQEAFAGESQANRKYLAFAQKADKEGFAGVAKLFRAAAAAETVHAHAHLRALDGVASTAENLQAAIAGEKFEFTEMYPGFLTEAEAEGDKRATLSIKNALAVEKIHFDLFNLAADAVGGGKDLAGAAIHVCEVCGDTVIGDAPDRCPVCNARKEKYFEVS
jgi:rubrerythrin